MTVIHSEHLEQVTFVSFFKEKYPNVRIFSIPNGGFRHKATAQKLKIEGVSSGVPDLYVPEWKLWIEMKRKKGGSLSPSQKDWIKYLEEVGDTVIIGKGWESARDGVESWLARNNK